MSDERLPVSGHVAANTAARICSTVKCFGLAAAGNIRGSGADCFFLVFMRLPSLFSADVDTNAGGEALPHQ